MNSLNAKRKQADYFIFDMRGKNMSYDQAEYTVKLRIPNAPFTKNIKKVRIVGDGWNAYWP